MHRQSFFFCVRSFFELYPQPRALLLEMHDAHDFIRTVILKRRNLTHNCGGFYMVLRILRKSLPVIVHLQVVFHLETSFGFYAERRGLLQQIHEWCCLYGFIHNFYPPLFWMIEWYFSAQDWRSSGFMVVVLTQGKQWAILMSTKRACDHNCRFCSEVRQGVTKFAKLVE